MQFNFELPAYIRDSLQAAYVVHDANTGIIDCNPKACELLGLSRDQLLGKTAMDPEWYFLDKTENLLDIDMYPVNQVISSQKKLDNFICGIVASAHPNIVWVQVSGVPIHQDSGSLSHIFITFVDVTQQIEAQKNLQQSEQRYRTVIESMQEGLVVQQHNGEIITNNPAAERILGLSADQLRGRKSIDPRWKSIREDGSDYPGEEHPAMQTLRTGAAFVGEIMGVSKPNGDLTWISINTMPIFEDGSDLPASVVATFTDITSLQKTRNALLSNSQFLSNVIEGATEGFCVCHAIEEFPFVEFTVWNSRMTELTGYTMEQINKLGWYQSLYPDPEQQERAMNRMNEMRTGNNLMHEEWEIVRADQTRRIFSISTRLLVDHDNNASVLALMHDITEEKKAEQALKQSELLFRGLVESSPMAMLVTTTEINSKVLHMNDRFTELFGYTINDVPDIEHWWPLAYPDPDYRNEVIQIWRERVENAINAKSKRIESVEANVTCKNKNIRNIEFHMAMLGDTALVVFNDLTAHKKAEEYLRQSAAVIMSTSEGVMITDTKLKILSINRAFTEITGYSEQEIIGQNPSILSSGKHDSEFYKAMWNLIKETGHWQGEIWNKRKNGEYFPEWLTISKILDKNGEVKNYVGVFSDISSVKQSEEQLYFLAHHDPLTELPNRSLIFSQIEQSIHNAKRRKNKFAVLFIDLDRFKHINDSYGHPTGDSVLLTAANRIRHTLRQNDVVARIGGDEFIVLLDDVEDTHFLVRIADKIIQSISEPIVIDEISFYISASVGIAIYPNDGLDATTLIANSDAAMYRAKESGRNTFQFYTKDMTEFALERVTLETVLRQTIERQELGFDVQPVYHMNSGEIIGGELLSRWHSKQFGVISPAKYIPLAEEGGLISRIGNFMLLSACKMAEKLYKKNIADIKLSINLSPRQFQRPQFYDEVHDILSQFTFPYSMLEFEITESVLVLSTEELISTLNRFRALGISLAIDDFGTGFSSLAYLKKLPLDKLKIDRSFVNDIPDDENDMAISKAIIALGQSLQLDVVAEGVETEVQKSFLKEQGCELMQGYLLSKPVSVSEFEQALLREV